MGCGRAGDSVNAERDALLFFLNRVRGAVVHAFEGLSEADQRARGVASGTNLLGLIHHLTAVEVHWFQRMFLGEVHEVDPSMQVPATVSRASVVTAYREACWESEWTDAACPDLSTLCKGNARKPLSAADDTDPGEELRVSLRRIVAHIIEETARHAGHADIIRERIDGATGF